MGRDSERASRELLPRVCRNCRRGQEAQSGSSLFIRSSHEESTNNHFCKTRTWNAGWSIAERQEILEQTNELSLPLPGGVRMRRKRTKRHVKTTSSPDSPKSRPAG